MLEPGLPDRACALLFDFDGTLGDLAPHPGAEMKPRSAGKGLAVRSFMDERPFRLCWPVSSVTT